METKFGSIISVPKKYTVKCRNRPPRLLGSRLANRNLSDFAAKSK